MGHPEGSKEREDGEESSWCHSRKPGQDLKMLQSDRVGTKRQDRKSGLVQRGRGGVYSSGILNGKSGERNLCC